MTRIAHFHIIVALGLVLGAQDAVAAPSIATISPHVLTQSGRLTITGSGFGTTQGRSVVKIGGVAAPVSTWGDRSITAYVPDRAPVGSVAVQVVASAERSNTSLVTVATRTPPGDHVKWRFQADGLYFQGRAQVAADGTVYAADVNGHLYALTPSGGLKWIFSVAPGNVTQSVDVGPDGTVYFAALNTVYAINRRGKLKWSLSDPTGATVSAGPNVGPDGNIYAVSEDSGAAGGIGEMVISPAGQLLSNKPGYTSARGQALRTREIVFGANQFHFDMNNVLDNQNGLQFFELGGKFLFAVSAGGRDEQPDTDAAGNVYSNIARNQLGVFDLSGKLLRSRFFSDNTTELTAPDVTPGGRIYTGENFPTKVLGLKANLNPRWSVPNDIGTLNGPVVDPSNSVVVAGVSGIGVPGAVQAINASTGRLLWQVNLPTENGWFVQPISRPRFSPDGTAAYVGMSANESNDNPYCYLYAFNTKTH